MIFPDINMDINQGVISFKTNVRVKYFGIYVTTPLEISYKVGNKALWFEMSNALQDFNTECYMIMLDNPENYELYPDESDEDEFERVKKIAYDRYGDESNIGEGEE